MTFLRHLARLAAITTLLGGPAVLVCATSPAASAVSVASASPAAAQDGWVRIAHLSPKAPAMDMYLYPFSNPADLIVLRDVSYGDVSAYQALSPGEYTVAMRGFGAPESSKPALTTSFMVSSRAAYTVAALGPDPGLRVEVLHDQMTAPAGKALVRVFQASLSEHQVTVSYGTDVLARLLAFGAATPYTVLSPGEQTVRFSASGKSATMPVRLAANTIHTIVVLDDSSGLEVDAWTDAVGSKIMPHGGANTGFGGTAPHPPATPVPWLLTMAFGAVLTGVGCTGLRRSRRIAAVC
ncbi:MAG: DUF4397 domain-containing protein [Streptosporangiaceae bacterium]